MASVKEAIGNFEWKSINQDAANDQIPEAGVETREGAITTDPPLRTIAMSHFDHAFTEVVPSF
jgi:hypothetical protein